MIYLLHIDTSADVCGIAISGDGVLLCSASNSEPRNHAAVINQLIDRLLGEIHLSLQQLSGVVVCAGPGSYTGLRIAMASAKGICFAADMPLIIDNKLELLATSFQIPDGIETVNIATILIAREQEYFIGIYNYKGDCVMPPHHIPEVQLADLLQEKEKLHIVSNAPMEVFYKLKVNFLSFSANITIVK
jgi:tRNA threonylcarbamoyladenosine biosynthesis protein TsaB